SGRELLEEIDRLRQENDRLRGVSVASALTDLLDPVLRAPGDPRPALASAAGRAGGLARDCLHHLAALLHPPDVELIGQPAQELELSLPHGDYALDGGVPLRLGQAQGRFRVCRRGLRLRGALVAPALVVPSRRRS